MSFDVMDGGHVLDACIDSGVIFSLMSKLAFDKINEYCGPVEKPEEKLKAVSVNTDWHLLNKRLIIPLDCNTKWHEH